MTKVQAEAKVECVRYGTLAELLSAFEGCGVAKVKRSDRFVMVEGDGYSWPDRLFVAEVTLCDHRRLRIGCWSSPVPDCGTLALQEWRGKWRGGEIAADVEDICEMFGRVAVEGEWKPDRVAELAARSRGAPPQPDGL